MHPTVLRKLLLCLLCLVAAPLGCTSDRYVIDQAEQVHGTLEPAVLADPELAGYLQEVGDRVIEQAAKMSARGKGPKKHFEGENKWMFSPDMRFHFVNSKTLNAFTTGGEHMYIYTQLLVECASEDELAAVVAHEYAHVYGKHVQKGRDTQLATLIGGAAIGAAAGYAIGGDDNRLAGASIGAGVGIAGGQFVNMGFTRGDEEEADKYGFRFYTRAGWDPERFGDFFQHMIDKGLDKTPAIVSDHPTLKSRVERSRQWASELGPEAQEWRRPPVADSRRFRDLQDRAVELGKRAPSDRSLENSRELLAALPRSCVSPLPQFEDQREAQEQLAGKSSVTSGQKKKKEAPAN